MTRPNVGTTIFIVGRDEELWDEEAHRARAAGAEHLEVFLEYPVGNGELRERQIRRLQNLVKGVRVLVHAPSSWLSLITPHERLWQLSLQEVQETLTVAVKLGAELVTIHGGPLPFPGFRRGQDAGTRFKEAIAGLLLRAHELSLTLAVENLSTGYPATPEELDEALAMGLRWSCSIDQAPEGSQGPLDLWERFHKRAAQVVVGPQVELEPLVGHLKGTNFGGFLTLRSLPDRAQWLRVQDLLSRLREAWKRA